MDPITMLAVLNLISGVFGNILVYHADGTMNKIVEEFLDAPASFGDELPPEGLRGLLVVGEPADGCSALAKPPPDVLNRTGKWVVLVARYNCSFEVKVRNAQTAGYDCAIVHNVNSSELETMSAKDPVGIEIPSVFVSDFAGLELSEKFQYSSGYYIMVNGDLPFNINTHLLLPFAIVVVLCLLVILVFMIVKCIKERRRARRHRLPTRALRKIPTCKFSKGDPYDTCAICLDDYVEGERLRVLPCAHAYHAACIDPWLTQNKRVCPVCKRRVLAAGERRASSDSSDTEPLLNDSEQTHGGTFVAQRQNPFVRAAQQRVRALLRERGRDADPEVPADDSEHNTSNDDNVSQSETVERTALLGRAARRQRRRARSAHSASARPQPEPHAYSINNSPEAQGEIGVAALPAGDTPPAPTVEL